MPMGVHTAELVGAVETMLTHMSIALRASGLDLAVLTAVGMTGNVGIHHVPGMMSPSWSGSCSI